MKLFFSLFVLLSLTAYASEKKAEEPAVLQENVEAQLPRLKERSNQEKLDQPLSGGLEISI